MDYRVGFMVILMSFLLRNYLTYSSIDVSELIPLKCRIAGVVLVEKKDRTKFNYTMAESACEALGLEFANRAHVEKARSFGFETCSYGWVADRYGVISRIVNNEKCGQNKTGVLSWTLPLDNTRSFNTYCFNASDTRINSCKPELMVTRPPSTVVPVRSSTLLPATPPGSTEWQPTSTFTVKALSTAKDMPRSSFMTTLMTSLRTTSKEAPPPVTTPEVTTPWPTEELPKPPENHAARQNEKIVFGGLPTALLILALVFFLAAVVLAICYIKKYKTNPLFSKMKEEKENVETKTFKETTTTESTKEEGVTPNGKEEKPQDSAAGTGQSVEAEV